MPEKLTALAESFRELFVGAMNGHVCDLKRREQPCIITISVIDTGGSWMGGFNAFIAKPTDKLVNGRFELATNTGVACVDNALANLGIAAQLAELEKVLGERGYVTLEVSRAMIYSRSISAYSSKCLVDRSADIQP